ncbi:hypothetical protein RLIN73S_05125 [Rhodanobacter lindaniclasticus]
MASALGWRWRWNSANTAAVSSGEAASRSASTTVSSKPQFMPWPWNGTIACAASPISRARPSRCQRIEVERGQRADRVAVVVRAEVRQQRQAARELRTEECRRRGGIGQGGETGCGALRGQEQGDGKAALGVRQRDAHVAAARPDVQRVRLQRVLVAAAAGLLQGGGQLPGGRDLQFLVGPVRRLRARLTSGACAFMALRKAEPAPSAPISRPAWTSCSPPPAVARRMRMLSKSTLASAWPKCSRAPAASAASSSSMFSAPRETDQITSLSSTP